MKRNFFLKICCCLLAMLLLAGCKGDDTENSELNYWELTDCAIVSFDANHYGFANDQGEVLYYRQMGNYLGDRDIGHLEGTMECYHWSPIGTFSLSKGPFTGTAYVPYSKFLKVATRCPMPEDYLSRFAVTFVKDGVYEKNISVTGKYEGQVTLGSDGSITLCGRNDEITVTYSMQQNEDDEGYLYYELCGDAERNAEFFMGGTAGGNPHQGHGGELYRHHLSRWSDGGRIFLYPREKAPLYQGVRQGRQSAFHHRLLNDSLAALCLPLLCKGRGTAERRWKGLPLAESSVESLASYPLSQPIG